MRRLIAILLLCASGAIAATKPAAAGGRLSDAEIEAAIKIKLAKSKIGKDGFTVHVKNGVATWQGTTDVVQHKGAATRMAKTAGAVQVVNNIKVSDAGRAKSAGSFGGPPRRVEVKP